MSTRALKDRMWKTDARDWCLLVVGAVVGIASLLAVGGCSREQAAAARPVTEPARTHGGAAADRSEFVEKSGSSAAQLSEKTPALSSRTGDYAAPLDAQPAAASKNISAESAPVDSTTLPLAVIAARHSITFTAEQTSSLVQLNEAFLKRIETDRTSRAPSADSMVTVDNITGAPSKVTPAEEARNSLSSAVSSEAADSHERDEHNWNAAQNASDARFKSLFGYSAFNAMQLERAREAIASTPTP